MTRADARAWKNCGAGAAVLVGPACAGKSYLASRVPALVLESSNVLLWCRRHGSKLPRDWSAELAAIKKGLSPAEVRDTIATFVETRGARDIGILQARSLEAAPKPTLLVGARYRETIISLGEMGYPILYIQPNTAHQLDALCERHSITRPEAETLLLEERTRCQLEDCRSIADMVVHNQYDNRSELFGTTIITALLHTGRVQ